MVGAKQARRAIKNRNCSLSDPDSEDGELMRVRQSESRLFMLIHCMSSQEYPFRRCSDTTFFELFTASRIGESVILKVSEAYYEYKTKASWIHCNQSGETMKRLGIY